MDGQIETGAGVAAPAQATPVWLRGLVLGSLIFAALSANFSWIHTFHDSDSLLMAFISIDRLTPFYWGDNRYGMLIPFLASAVTDYRWNILVQTQLMCAAAILLVLVFNVYFLHRRPGWSLRNVSIACLAFSLATVLFQANHRSAQTNLIAHPYHISLLLALIGVALLLRMRMGIPAARAAAAALCLGLSVFINPSSALIAGGLFVLLPERERPWRSTLSVRATGLGLTGAAYFLIRAYASRFPDMGGVHLAPLGSIPGSLAQLAANALDHLLQPTRVAVLVLTLLVVALLSWRGHFFRNLFAWTDGLVFTAIAVGLAVSIGSTDWVIRNLHEPRYWTTPIAILILVGASWLAGRIYDALQAYTEASVVAAMACALVLLLLCVRVFGLPSPARALNAIDEYTAGRWEQTQTLECTHMLGDYWIGWSSAFHARAHGASRPLHVVSSRSEVLEDRWSQQPRPQRKYCGVCGDPMNAFYQTHFGLGILKQTGSAGDICRYQH